MGKSFFCLLMQFSKQFLFHFKGQGFFTRHRSALKMTKGGSYLKQKQLRSSSALRRPRRSRLSGRQADGGSCVRLKNTRKLL